MSKEAYLQKINDYENIVKTLYTVGDKLFLTDKEEGDRETIYTHVCQYYITKIARLTFEMYGLGVGIFNMQGFERRNKDSKKALKRLCNYKGNIVTPNMKLLWDIFYLNGLNNKYLTLIIKFIFIILNLLHKFVSYIVLH